MTGTEADPRQLADVRSIPRGRPNNGPDMTNFDSSVPQDMAGALKEGQLGGHAAWNFYGYVWYEDGEFVEELMRVVNEEWGPD